MEMIADPQPVESGLLRQPCLLDQLRRRVFLTGQEVPDLGHAVPVPPTFPAKRTSRGTSVPYGGTNGLGGVGYRQQGGGIAMTTRTGSRGLWIAVAAAIIIAFIVIVMLLGGNGGGGGGY
jgi:hypothetical protein